MYCDEVSHKLLAKLEPRLGFELEYHSVDEVRRNTRQLQNLIDSDTGERTRELFEDEGLWVRNERVICQCDYRYWATRYAAILDWTGQLRLYEPNFAQRIIWDIRAEMQREGKALSTINNKARQVGISTDKELVVAHRVQFWPNTNAVVASSDPDKSRKMAEMMERCWQHQPWFLMPRMTGYNKGELIEFGSSAVSIQWGNQFTGISRGSTPIVAHLSECSEFVNPEELIDASLLRAMHESPWMFLALESTGKGRHNWWHKTWEFSKAHWLDGTARLRPVFLPWYVARDLYPTKTWIRTRPIPRGWKVSELTLQHAERAKAYVRSNELLRRYLGADWEMPREQMWFWETTRQEYAAKGELHKFLAEMPSDDQESFQTSAISVFDAELVGSYRERTRPPLGVFAVDGPPALIPPKLKPDPREINKDLPPIPIDHDYRLLPLRFTDFNTLDPNGKLLLWEFPEEGETYGLGVDPSGGVQRDRSVIEALRKGTLKRNDCQVAEFASPDLNATQLVPYVHAIGKLYSPSVGDRERQAKLVIEINNGGNLTQLELRKMGWTNFHRWMRAYDAKVLDAARANTLGWATTTWSRNDLIVNLMEYLRAFWIDINSPYFVDEMEDFEADDRTQKIKAAHGAHDDRIMGLGMVLFSLHDLEVLSRRPSIARERAAKASEPEEPAPTWVPPVEYTAQKWKCPPGKAVYVPAQEEVEEDALWATTW